MAGGRQVVGGFQDSGHARGGGHGDCRSDLRKRAMTRLGTSFWWLTQGQQDWSLVFRDQCFPISQPTASVCGGRKEGVQVRSPYLVRVAPSCLRHC